VIQGHRVVYEWDAVSLEDSRTRIRDEWRARVRMAVRNTAMAPYILRRLVEHRRGFFAFQMVSHKMMRWWLWVPLVVAFASSSALALSGAGAPYAAAAALQAAFYLVALASLALGSRVPVARSASAAGFFVMINVAACAGTLQRLAGAQRPAWEPIRSC